MLEGTGLKIRHRGHLQWHDLSTEFHKNLPIGSKVIRGDTQTDRQTGNLMSLSFLFKESRLKIEANCNPVHTLSTIITIIMSHALILGSDCINDLDVMLDGELYFHCLVDILILRH
jgi:hypothetical protein